jgi:CHASE2 domain-containing sensor protein
MRTFFNRDALLITLMTFVMIGIIAVVPATFSVLQPLGKAFSDFDLTDLVTSQLRDASAVAVDTNIVLVNIGNLNRAEIARELALIAAHEPRVIMIDAFFRKPKSPELDTPLVNVLASLHNVVLASELSGYDSTQNAFASISGSHPMFTEHAVLGYANLIINNEQAFRTVRSFSPSEPVGNERQRSLPVKAARMFDSVAVAALEARGKANEFIRFRGGIETFYSLDAADVLDPGTDLSLVRNKIVIMGYLGPKIGVQTLEDMFFTPLNEKYAGRSLPDMYGAVVHANVISMILHREYIDRLPTWAVILLAVVFCYFNVVFLVWMNNRYPAIADPLVVVQQIALTAISLTAMVAAFDWFHFKLDLTLTILALVLSGEVLELYDGLFYHAFGAVRKFFRRKS